MADYSEKHSGDKENVVEPHHGYAADAHDEEVGVVNKSENALSRDLKGRHMQMIAIGTNSPCSSI